ncbi:hypothetical protein ABZ914_03745 [Spirillospora sp. NPDC046719]
MSNIFTDFARVYARADSRIDEVEAQWIAWMLLGPRGSYHVPVCNRRGPQGRYVDVQYGSGKGNGLGEFCENHVGWAYSAIWVRRFDEGGSQDVIWHDADGPSRFCRYGFDEVRVTTADGRPPRAPEASWRRHPDGTWRVRVAGSYRTGNNRSPRVGPGPSATPTTVQPPPDPADLPLPTPTTPSIDGEELTSIHPSWLDSLTHDDSTATLIEYRWRGRVVHWASFQPDEACLDPDPDWRHRSADDWDNCLDAEFLRLTGAADLLAPEEVYERDRRDWETDSWYHRFT